MGENPKVKKSSKKLIEDPGDLILPDLDISPTNIHKCETCNIRVTDAKAYESHLQGKKHQKKLAQTRQILAKKAGREDKNDDDEEENEEDEKDLYCDVCEKEFSGYMSYIAHIEGHGHAKNIKKKKLIQKLSTVPGVLREDYGASDDDDILPKTYARCKTCGKEFTGPESYSMHLKSSAHKKKIKQLKMMETLKTQDGHADDNSCDDEFYKKCEVCQKSFTGVVPYKMHMESRGHMKNLEKQKVAEDLKEHYSNDDSNEGYLCKECNKIFTDPLSFKNHLSHNSHEKQKAKLALLEFLNAHPEIAIVYPEDESDNESDSDGPHCSYYLICKLCQVSFTGPDNAKEHVETKKHLNLKKKKN